jgi:macrodomain Ter protein organizer (MatP/YcbG family)
MKSKLRLTIEQGVFDKAKVYAQRRDMSLSEIIENYLKAITKEIVSTEISPLVKSLRGAFNAPKDFDYKTELTKALSEKYLCIPNE